MSSITLQQTHSGMEMVGTDRSPPQEGGLPSNFVAALHSEEMVVHFREGAQTWQVLTNPASIRYHLM